MKRLLYLLALVCAVTFTACSNDVVEHVEDTIPDSLCRFTVNLAPQFKREMSTRAVTSDLTTLCTNIDIYFTNTNNKMLVAEAHQVNTEANFGSITVGLPTGKYNIYVFAHNGGTISRYNNDNYALTYPDYFGGDAFSAYKTSLTITQDTQQNLALERIVSKFSLVLTDSRIPDGVTKIRLKMNNLTTTYVCSLGSTVEKNEDYVVKDFDLATHEGNSYDLIMFPFTTNVVNNLRSGSCDVVVEALKADGTVFESHSFPGTTMGIGCISKYTGALFSATYSGFTLTVDPSWGEMIVSTF